MARTQWEEQVWTSTTRLAISSLSWAYKRVAVIVLLALLVAFFNFALALAFFLVSESWGAPVILSRGNELVDRTERTVGEMTVRLNDLQAELARADIESAKAAQDLERVLAAISSLSATVASELASRVRIVDSYRTSVSDLLESEQEFQAFLASNGGAAAGREAFDSRLIARRQAAAESLAAADARYRLASVRSELRLLRDKIVTADHAISTLTDVHGRLRDPGKGIGGVAGSGGPDMIVFAERTIALLSELVLARKAFAITEQRRNFMLASAQLLVNGINQIRATPLGQAVDHSVDVIFVPYSNAGRFSVGTRLYSCRLLILVCRNVGAIRDLVDGEATLPHPLFNRPLRGTFVQVELVDKAAGKDTILHAGRAPLFL